MSRLWKIALCAAGLAALSAKAEPPSSPVAGANATPAPDFSRAESVRSACIANRRRVCGRVLLVTPAGVVVESGYASLLEPPFNHSWLNRANSSPAKPVDPVEGVAADSLAVGTVFLTDLPRRKTVHQYDYVALIGYPAGSYDYAPVPGVTKKIRRFAAGLEKAVTLTLAGDKRPDHP